jgi:serine/threonine-protein kinase
VKISAIPQQAHLVPGYRLDGRYELLYPYAQGGMATVWVARVQGKHGFEKLVAVKTILPNLAVDQEFRTMFLDEASIASRIRHPNVADIVDLGEEANTLYMVLEWVNGDSWAKLYGAVEKVGQPFPVNLLLRIAADACAGLHAAHELCDDMGAPLNVVHRDVSPQNILITIAGVTKVIDFGIAKALDRVSENTKTGMIKGKAQYTSPEQVKGHAVDRRADIWAVGTMLYQYLSGRLPYEGKNDLATLKNLAAARPPPPLPPSVPPRVASVVMTALGGSPEARYPTALDMQRALEAVMPQPTTPTDVAAFMAQHLSERMEMRRTDLAEALAEAEQRSGAPRKARARLGSFPELARPAILDQVLGGRSGESSVMSSPALLVRAGESSAMPQISPLGPVRIVEAGESSAMPRSSPLAPAGALAAADAADDAVPTRMRSGLSSLRPAHWLVMILGAAVPIVVWSLVVYVAIHGPLGRRPPVPGAPAVTAPGSALPR